jgi:flagellar biosynthesis protein FlhF
MNLKRYRAETVQEALRAVREDLGPDAFVLSTRVVPVRGIRGWLGGRLIEITAAADRPRVSDDRHFDERPGAGRPTRRATSERASDSIAARLQAAGLDADFAREVADAHPREQRRAATSTSLKQTIADTLAPLATDDEAYAPVEVFIGPPGAGKTTTIAKIAAQERARVRGKRLGLISADGFRVGAVEQLRLYADIIGAPLDVARTPMELELALDKARRPLLLDTAGRSPSDDASRDMLRVLASRRDVRAHLVLSAGTPKEQVKRIFDRFEEARPSRIVITKLDEAESLAPLVPVLRDRGLPLSYLGTGQSVPEDLERATAPAIAAWVSGEGTRKGARIPCA